VALPGGDSRYWTDRDGIEEKWNLPALTWRDAAATAPLGALDLTVPPAFLTPPQLPAPALAWDTW
jgi:hypothetical protein